VNAQACHTSRRLGSRYVTNVEPLFGLVCQESARDLFPVFLALLTRFALGLRERVPRQPLQRQ
jgi:hypothetical protein